MSKFKIALISVFSITVIAIITLVVLYKTGLNAPVEIKDGTKEELQSILFVVDSGSTSAKIVGDLYDAGLLKNKYSAKIYFRLHSDKVLKAGKYYLNKGMTAEEIFDYLANGMTAKEIEKLTFIEGKRLNKYVELISEGFGYSTDEIYSVINDKNYLTTLIDKYWFLTDEILDDSIYHPLEGYLYPDTYTFTKSSSIQEIIEIMLDNTELKLNDYKEQLEASEYSVHQIITMASIAELEAVSEQDRKDVAQVIYRRLRENMNLGMDVTTYYAVKKEMSEDLTVQEFNTVNPYNTRDTINMAGKLPVGPICNPSMESIDAVLNPGNNNYLYFFADVKTGEVFFADDYDGFIKIINEVGK